MTKDIVYQFFVTVCFASPDEVKQYGCPELPEEEIDCAIMELAAEGKIAKQPHKVNGQHKYEWISQPLERHSENGSNAGIDSTSYPKSYGNS